MFKIVKPSNLKYIFVVPIYLQYKLFSTKIHIGIYHRLNYTRSHLEATINFVDEIVECTIDNLRWYEHMIDAGKSADF